MILKCQYKIVCSYHNVRRGRLSYHRGWGVLRQTYTPIYPLPLSPSLRGRKGEGNHKRLKFLSIVLLSILLSSFISQNHALTAYLKNYSLISCIFLKKEMLKV